MALARCGAGQIERPEKYVAESRVLAQPVVFAVLFLPLLYVLLLVGRVGVRPLRIVEVPAGSLPLSPAVEEIAEEDHRVRMEVFLELSVGSPHVVVRDQDRQGGEGPRPARVGVRVDQLGVRNEDEVVRLGAFWLR